MHSYPLISLIAATFTAAWILGIITQKLRLSPIVGYLLAGVAIGPFTPGFVGDASLAPQLAEMGVILLMFGVGLHFHLKDLMAVRKVAVPGALGQSLAAAILGVVVALIFGMSFKTGLVLGMSMAVASTVVLIRGLSDNNLLSTTHGHVAVGWLIVEDILTVILLVILPALGTVEVVKGAADAAHAAPAAPLWQSLLIALGKLVALIALLLLVGVKAIPWFMVQVARLRSRELFTLTVLVMAIAIAAGAYKMFGASMALGAFLAGMVVGQSPVAHQAAADALPFRDAFAVLFFASVGMLFDPRFLIEEPLLVLAGLVIVMIGKPLAALLIVGALKYPLKTGLTVAFGLAQIGEFSFILSEVARAHNLMDDTGHNLIVACAIISITVNPFLYRLIPVADIKLQKYPALYRFLTRDSAIRSFANDEADALVKSPNSEQPLAVVIGYGPVGQTVDTILRGHGVQTIVVDMNMETIQRLTDEGRAAVFGDACNTEVLRETIMQATHMVITLPHSANRNPMIINAKQINPQLNIIVRARYVSEGDELAQVGADSAVFEEAEAAAALAGIVLAEQGADNETIQRESSRIRRELTSDYF